MHIDPIDHPHRYKEVHRKTEDRLKEEEEVALQSHSMSQDDRRPCCKASEKMLVGNDRPEEELPSQGILSSPSLYHRQ